MVETTDSGRGAERESSLSRSVYFSERYFELTQLFSLSHQIEKIHKLRPKDVLEIGVGNGFTSSFLRKAGYDIVTADINPALEPDICAPLVELESHLDGRRFDLVVCCEVLEHMPFEMFPSNLAALKALGDRLFMTLPNHRKYFGIGGVLRIPRLKPVELSLHLSTRLTKRLPSEHFWEVGHSRETSLSGILSIIKDKYKKVEYGNFSSKPYHRYFVCE